jgi:transposase InsO family protein
MAKKEIIPARYRLKVKQRLAIVEWAMERGIKPAGERFGLDRKTVREWRDRYRARGILGLVPAYPERRKSRVPADVIALIEQARRELQYGAARTRIWLRRAHKRQVPMATISRTFVRLGLRYLPRSRRRASRPRQLKLFEKPNPGDSVQVDVKIIKLLGRKAYQYTAIDDCTRFRVLRLYRELNQRSSVDFLGEVRRALPFPIHQLQCDNGTEFSLDFALTVQEAGIRLRYIRPRRPQQNGKVERSHRIDNEEFWRREAPSHFGTAVPALQAWERRYNFERFSVALHGETPAEKLQRLLPDANLACLA